MNIFDLNHIEAVESSKVIGGGYHYDWYDKNNDDDDDNGKKKIRNLAVATSVAVAGDRKFFKYD
ncbi:hypothetical protein NIES592_23380 [Fischerella major NIES-592]|uniref:Uncharacterized protein n=2 Tax=Fischerella TaxID=1190 RepID=A0A1U7GSW4_9CYAN|nr:MULTISPECIES: hypothetical protein [Fischerella]OKH10945.1 hypothetical protein NIES592_23380 [Fischerella major NIES-592]PMB39417.1 hypothetical protein CEN41_21615 [Fischerella thermalis CCMEE 5330]BAU07348.1 hypothetical protein FIS3754_32760 [Fischerella sp. NIES-3754]BCX09675.1 MAG: hypothetical protein KatS3mg066_3534 [Fischerella sp.]